MKRLFKKLILRIFIVLIALTLLAVPALYLIAINSPTVSAAWFNDNWAYRKAVSTTIASNSSDLSNLQMLLTVDTSTGANGIGSGKMQASCQDLRFTNQAGKLLPYYIDSGCTTTSTKIWVMVDLVPKNTTTMTLYMYYGNPSAPTGSNSQPYFDNVVGLVGYWTMNDGGSSATASDHSVSGNNGTLSATPAGTNTTVTQMWTQGATGQYGASLGFDGSDDYVQSGSNITPTSAVTVMGWMKLRTQNIGYKRVAETHYNTGFYIGTSLDTALTTTTPIAFIIDGSPYLEPTLPSAVDKSQWHHYAGTWDGSIMIVYLDGVRVGSQSRTSVTLTPAVLGIGKDMTGSSAFTDGQIDDVKIYNTARTAAQILNDYNNRLPNGQTLTIASTAPTTVIPTTSIPTDANAEKAPSPVAYWKFDDGTGTNAQDSSQNNNDGTISGATWQTEDMCVSGKCLKFDGTDDVVTVANTVSNIQTVSFWVRPQTTSEQFIDLNGSAYIQSSSGTLSATGFTSPTIYVNGKVSSTLTANTWQHVAVTTGTAISASTIKIGNVSTSYITGFIDEVKIYPYARSAAQILADYNSFSSQGDALSTQGVPLKALSNGLVGYWKMDEASANSCTGSVNDNCDSSGNGNDGAWNGDATSAAGKYGNGTTFDGTGDYVSSSSNLGLTGDLTSTLSVWVKFNSVATQGILQAGDGGTSLAGMALYVSTNGNGSIGVEFFGSNGARTSAGVVTTGQWYHIVATKTPGPINTTTKLYIDGVLQAFATSATTTPNVFNGLMYAGAGHTSTMVDYLNASLDETRIYNRALSPKEVSDLYNFAPGPKVYLKMDEGSGTGANDTSGNSNNGTVNSGTWTTGKYGKGVGVSGTTGSNVSVSDFGY